jgi:predicted DNA-binding transcriptional regulator YafY
MDHPTTRVLATLELLQSRPRFSGPELAERLEVDRRTVRRYITILQDLGIPVEAERGRYGAYRIRPGYKLPPLMFSDDEALALTLGLVVARRLGLTAAAPAVDGALAKVERVLPEPVRERVSAVLATVQMDLPVSDAPPPSETLLTLSAAVRHGHRVRMRYRSRADEDTIREVDPYGVVFLAGRWFMTGYCHLRQDLRVFRLDRMLSATEQETTFTRPEAFDPIAYVQASLATAPATWAVEVILHLPLDEARRRVPPAMASVETCPDGTLLRCSVEDLNWAARALLWIDCPFTVRQPPELHAELRRLAHRLLNPADPDSIGATADA